MFLFIKIESPNNTSSVQPGESQLFQRPLEVEAPCPNHISCLPMGPENAGGRGVHSFFNKIIHAINTCDSLWSWERGVFLMFYFSMFEV